MKVIVTGMGPGDSGLLTAEAEKTIRQADVVLTSKRLAQDLTKLNSEVKVMGVMETVDFIRLHSKERMTVCVAASGDTGFYSIASTIEKRVGSDVKLEFCCGDRKSVV